MSTITLWSSDVLAHVKRASKPSIERAVRDAAIAFCEKTWLWAEDLTRITTVINQQDYTLTDPTDAEIVVVDNVRYKINGADDDQFQTLIPISQNQMDLHNVGSWAYGTSAHPSYYWVDVVDKVLHLLNIPTVASTLGLLVRVILRPSDTCASVPDFLYEEHSKAITQGAVADLFSQEVMDWSDVQDPNNFKVLLNKAVYYDRLFESSCNEAKIKKFTGATKRPLTVRFQPWV